MIKLIQLKQKIIMSLNFLEINDNGYGDYINLDIDGNGYIKNWVEKVIPAIKKII